MSNVKGNDIDDLFKRASDKYPLRTDSADWDKLSAALDKDPSLIVPPPNTEEDRRRRKRFFWLFLLLPLGGLVYYVGQITGHNLYGTTPSAKVSSSSKTPAQSGANSGTTAPDGERMPAAAPVQQVPATPGATPGQQSPAPTGTVPAQPGASSTEQASTHPAAAPAEQASAQPRSAPAEQASTKSGSAPAEQPSAHPGSGQQASAHPGHAPAQQGSTEPKPSPAISSLTRTNPAHTGTPSPEGHTSDAPAGQHANQTTFIPTTPARHRSVNKGLAPKPADKQNQVATGDVYKVTNSGSTATRYPELSTLNYQRAPTTGGVALNVSVNANNSQVSTKENNLTAKGKTDKNTTKNKKQAFLYGGLIVAPDLSTVKYQSIKGMGTTFGVLLGYQLNRKWAIETGAYYDHKRYYTDGEYFKKEPSNPAYKLLNVDGSCNMWEIPLNVRYNLSSGEKTKWFATAGLSTYLMTGEKYVSTYTYNGNTWPFPWNNKTPSQYWFSIINLSVGYEQKLGRIGNLRLEPYLRIPLKGMGSGSLPIMSAGLNIGITRRIW